MKKIYALLGLLALGAGSLAAGSVSYTGTFDTDDQIETLTVNLAVDSIVTFQTLGYGGGTNSASVVIPAGGFDPRLTWFDASGSQIGSNAGPHCGPNGPFLDACNDAYFNGVLTAGSYYLVLTQDGNDPNGDLIDGFGQTGNPNFTASGPCPMFCDSLSGNALTGNWDVEVTTTALIAPGTPEPATFALSGSVLALFFFAFARKNRRA